MLTQAEGEKLTGRLAIVAAEAGVKAFVAKILKAIKSKGLTLGKVLQIYAIVEKAVKDIEVVLASK
jgi:hypothetical protein